MKGPFYAFPGGLINRDGGRGCDVERDGMMVWQESERMKR